MPYTAEIISVGTELLLGNIVNTDARDVSVALAQLGINVYFMTVVGDNPARVEAAVAQAKTRADIIITTGGLGPTYDDLTKQTVAAAFGKELVLNEDEAEKIREFFRDRDIAFTDNNLRQAYLPQGCTIFDNGRGTAPGCAFEADGKHVLMLPGPPRECRAMIESGLVPYLKSLAGEELFSQNIHIFGIGESAVETKFRDLMEQSVNPTLAPYAKDGETLLRITARAESQMAADAMIAPMLALVRETLGDKIYGIDTSTLENTVVMHLRERGLTISSAESCTGGLFATRITEVPGASRVFRGGVTAYTNDAKMTLVGVPRELISQFGVVSQEISESLASCIRDRLEADLGIGVTGVAGPGPDDEGNPEGRVYVSLAAPDGVWTRKLDLYYDRERIRAMAASHAFDMARRWLTGQPVLGEV